MATIKIKRGDTAPALRYAFPAEVDLTDATVAFIMSPRPGGQSVVVAPAAVLTTEPPVAEYTWSKGDTDTDGSYYAEFEVSFPDGRVQRFPSSGYLRINISQWLDSSVPIGGDGPIPPQRQWLTVADLGGAVAEQVTGQVDALVAEQVLPRVADIAATAAAPAAQAAVAEAQPRIDAAISTAAESASEAGRQRTAADQARAGADIAAGQAANTANIGPALPSNFLLGLNNWTSQRNGSPVSALPTLKMTAITDDPVFGHAVRWEPSAAGDNILSKGVLPVNKGPFRVTARLRVLAPTSGTIPLALTAIGIDRSFATPHVQSTGTIAVPADGSEVTLTSTFSAQAADGADLTFITAIQASRFVRFGLRTPSNIAPAAVVVIGEITISDATEELARKRAGVSSSTFETRAAAIATTIPATVQNISLLHDGELLNYTRKPAAMSASYVPLTTAGTQHWVPLGEATLKHWGAVSDANPEDFTGTNCQPMMQAMLLWASTNDIRRLSINRGNFLIEKAAPGVPTLRYLCLNLELVGQGMWASNLIFKDRRAHPTTPQPMISKPYATAIESARFSGFSITSDWGYNGLWGDTSHAIAMAGGGGILHYNNLRFKNIGQMCLVTGGAERLSVTDCVFDTSQRDGINASGTRHVYIAGNFFRNVCDDAVAVATPPSAGNYSESVIVEGNIFVDCQGMNVVSNQTLIVRNNIMKRPHVRAIQAGRASGVWAAESNARFNLIIEGNIVTDVFKRNRFGGAGADYAYISVVDITSDTGGSGEPMATLTPVSGSNYTFNPDGLGGIVSPAPWFHAFSNRVGNLNIQVKNNICMRTLEPVASYLDYGFGPRFVQNVGPYTGDVIEADFYETHYQLKGVIRNALLEGNISYGAGTPIYMTDYLNGAAVEADNVVLRGNILTNIRGVAAINYEGGYMVFAEDNLIDGDPLHRHSARGPNGTWTSATGLAAYRATRGKIAVNGGTVRNLATIAVETGAGRAVFLTPVKVMADLAGRGDLAANKGIRNVPRKIPVDYIRVGSDPAAADYGQISTIGERYADVMPTSGHYLAGHVVTNASPVASGGQIVTGWLRLTTGNGHAAGTDWSELRTTLA